MIHRTFLMNRKTFTIENNIKVLCFILLLILTRLTNFKAIKNIFYIFNLNLNIFIGEIKGKWFKKFV